MSRSSIPSRGGLGITRAHERKLPGDRHSIKAEQTGDHTRARAETPVPLLSLTASLDWGSHARTSGNRQVARCWRGNRGWDAHVRTVPSAWVVESQASPEPAFTTK